MAVAHVVPTTPQQRVGTTIWLSYLAASVADAQLADILADAKRGQEDVTTQLLQAESGRSDAVCRARARRLIALADGLASRVLIGDLSAASALALIDEAWEDWGAGVETSP
ncbi:TetR family transcriptional regulator C-terminal domain-containing protein [Mobilicoccus sp.]|uniref:TetR family transcriptional regulator C-terminal domain-containing protein n=1 Tax=Mobilicoccus sp. TaxID=2034349 RepID=UPI0028AEB15E|nr:TetR family transcriptional regulator C-terminal domain-containing protein [Mobilicoccus sp.]